MTRPRRFLFSLVPVLVSACTTRGRGPDVLAQPIPERRPLEVWSGGQRYDVHGVRVVGDSVMMVPHWKPPACDSCRIALPRAAVDSVRVREFSPSRTIVLSGILLGCFWLLSKYAAFPQGGT